MSTRFYIETDGMVYLVERGKRWTLPRSPKEIPFELEPKQTIKLPEAEVLFCLPLIEHHPRDWHHKDEIPAREDVDPLVREVVHRTLPRVVAEAVISKDDRLLLVKPSRGFNEGRWTLPGGFVSYGESPAQSVAREVEEEVGVPCRVGRLLGVESFLGKETFYMWHMFFYEVEVLGEDFRPAADEIESVSWFPLDEAVRTLWGVKRALIERLIQSGELQAR